MKTRKSRAHDLLVAGLQSREYAESCRKSGDHKRALEFLEQDLAAGKELLRLAKGEQPAAPPLPPAALVVPGDTLEELDQRLTQAAHQ